MPDQEKLAKLLREIRDTAAARWTVVGKSAYIAQLAIEALTELGDPEPRGPLAGVMTSRGRCPHCGRPNVHVRTDGKLRKHDNVNTGFPCDGSERVPA